MREDLKLKFLGVLYTEVKKYKNVIRVKFKSLDKDKVEHGKAQFDERYHQ